MITEEFLLNFANKVTFMHINGERLNIAMVLMMLIIQRNIN